MEIPDLQVLPGLSALSPQIRYLRRPVLEDPGNPASLTWIPRHLTVRTVGWLGRDVPTTGEVPDECIARFFEALASDQVVDDLTMGFHACEICLAAGKIDGRGVMGQVVRWRDRERRLLGHGHHVVWLRDTVYICPVLILHYIVDHRYRPPDEFLRAVSEGAFVTSIGQIRRVLASR